MSRTTPELKSVAERLLGYETAAGKSAAEHGTAALRVCEKFRHLLSTLLGPAGFRALLARAVTLAKAEAPELRPLQVKADGSLEGLSTDNGAVPKGEVILVAQLVGLLVVFCWRRFDTESDG